MNNFYTSKKLLRITFLLALLFSVTSIFNSCKDDEEEYKDYLAQFEVKVTTGMTIDMVSTQVGAGTASTYFPPATTTWTIWKSDEFFVNSSQSALFLNAKAVGINADSELTVTIYIDGVPKRTKTYEGAGEHLAQINYHFLDLN